MTSFSVDTAVGVVTALTGLIAAAVATTQLSYRHRMMRTATWAQEQVPSATGKRKQCLEDMQRWAQSEVVAARGSAKSVDGEWLSRFDGVVCR